MEPYEVARPDGPMQISHFDFYRFDDPHEWEDAGFRDVFAAPGLKLVEWPEKAAEFLPPADLSIVIEPGAGRRPRRALRRRQRARPRVAAMTTAPGLDDASTPPCARWARCA